MQVTFIGSAGIVKVAVAPLTVNATAGVELQAKS